MTYKLFETFPRMVGRERRLVYSKDDLMEWLKKANGLKQCFVSLYSFEEAIGDKPIPTSAYIDSILLQTDYETVGKLHSHLGQAEHHIVFNGFDFDVYIIVPATDGSRLEELVNEKVEELNSNLKTQVIANKRPDFMVLYPGTINTRTGLKSMLIHKDNGLPTFDEIKRVASE